MSDQEVRESLCMLYPKLFKTVNDKVYFKDPDIASVNGDRRVIIVYRSYNSVWIRTDDSFVMGDSKFNLVLNLNMPFGYVRMKEDFRLPFETCMALFDKKISISYYDQDGGITFYSKEIVIRRNTIENIINNE